MPRGGRLELVDVGYRFPDSDAMALHHVNLTVEPGETLALVGATGSGKSVLTGLLSRLYDVTEGVIRVDGVDIRDLRLSALRRAVATAFEDPTLFSMSVAEISVWAARTTPRPKRSWPPLSTSPRRGSFTTCPSGWTPASANRA